MSIWIARLLGPIILLLAISMVARPAALLALSRQFLTDKPLILISGILATLAGLLIVNVHNVWYWGWPVIITLFGWALLIGGAVRILSPDLVNDLGNRMLEADGLVRWIGGLWALLGGYLSCQGISVSGCRTRKLESVTGNCWGQSKVPE